MRGALADLPVEYFVPIDPELIDGAQLSLPSLAGLTPEEAVKRLDALGLRSTVSETEVASYQPEGTVAYTSPGAGSTVQPGATVTLYLSNGVPPPPEPEPEPSDRPTVGRTTVAATPAVAVATPATAAVAVATATPAGNSGDGNPAAATPATATTERDWGQPLSWRLTSAATRPPSARPATFGCTAFITCPIACGPDAPLSAIADATRAASSASDELGRQVAPRSRRPQRARLRTVGVSGVGVRRGSLLALLQLARQHLQHLVVGELAGLLAGDLLVGDRGQHHAQRRTPDVVLGTHGVGEVCVQLLLEAHATIFAQPAEVSHCFLCPEPEHFLPPPSQPRRPGSPTPLWEAHQYRLRRVTVPVLDARC